MAKRILVVEDGGDLRAIVVAVLTRVGGYETIEAANGREAVEKAVSERPDLILMDGISPTFQASTRPEL
jgi:two-component system, OmpR family, response regulator